MKQFLVALFLVGLIFSFFVAPVSAYYTNMPASVVLGQPDFVSGSTNQGNSNPTQSSTSGPTATFSDGTRLFLTDLTNNRVLIWNSIPTKSNTPADVVLGQPDFVSSTANNGGVSASTFSQPVYGYSDGTHLIVSDRLNNRVLIWNSIPTRNQQPADIVVGQPDFTTVSSGLTASKFNRPFGVYIYNGKLFISETNNIRVLIYNSIPTTNGASADVVVGQDDFNSALVGPAANRFGSVPTITGPRGILVYNNKLLVSDNPNNRVLIFDPVPTANGASASVVIGQPDFVSKTADNGGISCASLNNQDGLLVTANGRLFLGEFNRILIFNQIPTSNFQIADIVLGQASCSTRTANFGGISASSLSGTARAGAEVNQKLFVTDGSNNRLLIFNNIISSPGMDISLPLTSLPNGNLRVYGNVELGEHGTYALQWVKAEVNGEGLGYVTNLSGGRDTGTNNTLYDFYHDFSPGSILNSDISNFTLKLVASSFNADTTSLFYFTPFNLSSASNTTFTFSVNTYQIQRLKDNVDHFSVFVRSSTTSPWTEYISGISPNLIDTNTGQVLVTAATPGISFPNVVLPGIYDVKVRSISKNGSSGFDTNTISGVSLSGSTGSGVPVSQGMVLQINSIDGNTDILSSFNPSGVKTNYQVSGLTPKVSGISWANSFISLNITNKNNTNESKTYTTRVNSDSSFTLFPSFYPDSILNFSVTKDGMYNFIPSFNVTNQ